MILEDDSWVDGSFLADKVENGSSVAKEGEDDHDSHCDDESGS